MSGLTKFLFAVVVAASFSTTFCALNGLWVWAAINAANVAWSTYLLVVSRDRDREASR